MKELVKNEKNIEDQLDFYKNIAEDFERMKNSEEQQEDVTNYFFTKRKEIELKMKEHQESFHITGLDKYEEFLKFLNNHHQTTVQNGFQQIIDKLMTMSPAIKSGSKKESKIL